MPSEPLDKKFEAFGWKVIKADGHDFDSLRAALAEARAEKGRPSVILAKNGEGQGRILHGERRGLAWQGPERRAI